MTKTTQIDYNKLSYSFSLGDKEINCKIYRIFYAESVLIELKMCKEGSKKPEICRVQKLL